MRTNLTLNELDALIEQTQLELNTYEYNAECAQNQIEELRAERAQLQEILDKIGTDSHKVYNLLENYDGLSRIRGS